MKTYDQLTYNEKIQLVLKGIEKWKNREQPYTGLSNKYSAGFMALDELYNYGNTEFKTPPAKWQDEIVEIINLLDV